MIGLDTNVLVRYLVEDEEEQAGRAAALIEKAADQDERLYVPQVVLCEVAWVLASAYGRSRAEVAAALKAIVRTAQFVIEDADLAHRALARFEAGTADFADYVVAESAAAAGCDRVATFDRVLPREGGFVRP